jgi:hypothetical protein
VAVEFGARDGLTGSNTARLREQGWRTVLFDRDPMSDLVTQALITRENINEVFRVHGVPDPFDLLSIDIDGNDLWVWEALTFRPRVVVIEYNPSFGPDVSVTVPYDPDRAWDGTNYYGASALALCRLGRRKGYRLFASTRSNLIFVRRSLTARQLLPWHLRLPLPSKRPDGHRRPWEVYR